MKIFLLILSICFFSYSTQIQSPNQIKNQNDSIEVIPTQKENKSLERLSKTLETVSLPEIKEVGENVVTRNSDIKDEKGWMLPPYKNAEIKHVFDIEPQIGEKATIIPLKVKLEPFQLKIIKATKSKNSQCHPDKTKEFYWLTEFETITEEEILKIQSVEKGYNNEMPFGVFIIYPSVQFAKSLDISSISKTFLPPNIAIKRIESAIDVDNDSKPDLLSVRFCCGDSNRESDEECPYICHKYYQKINGIWKIVNINDFYEMC